MSNVLQQLNDEMASVVGEVQRSLVLVSSNSGGSGAGTIWHPDGLIITNAHVIQRLPVTVTLADGRVYQARPLAYDTHRDIAALLVDATGLPTVKLGDSRSLQPGQWVMALGHPMGVHDAFTAGVVIGKRRETPEAPRHRREWIVVNLHLRPGYSGGPLLDDKGRLVGINTMMNGPDVGMAVPVHSVKAFLREKIGSRGRAA